MVKERLEVTLEPETIKYLEGKGPRGKSKAVEEALSLLQKSELNPGITIEEKPTISEVKRMRIVY